MRLPRLGPAASPSRTFAVVRPDPEQPEGFRRPAELASMASRAENAGSSAIEFEVAHRPQPADTTDPGFWPAIDSDRPRSPTETLGFAAAGLRVDVATWPAASADVATSHELSETSVLGGRPAAIGVDGGGGWAYRGSAVLNPGFLTGASRSMEVLVSLGPAPWTPSHRDTLMLTRTICQLSHFATETGLPILSITSPAAPSSEAVGTTRGDGSGERLRGPFAPCIRFTIGLDVDRPLSRLAFEANVAEFAAEAGLSLRIGDQRSGRGRGEWFAITPFVASRYRTLREELFGWAPDTAPAEAAWVTVLGPARVGATVTICRWLERSNVGCLGIASSVLQDISFVNLLLPMAPARTGERLTGAVSSRAPDGLGPVASRCGLTTRQGTQRDGGQQQIDIRTVADHLLLAGDPMPCRFERRSRTGVPSSLPLWAGWDMPAAGVETVDVLRAVVDGLAPHTRAVEVAFARARRGDGGQLLGRAKLAVTPTADWQSDAARGSLGEMAARAQDAAAHRLARLLGMNPGDVRIQVAWRERWLSHLGTGD